MKIQRLKLESKDFKIGDIVLNKEKGNIYLIANDDYTLIHKHRYFKVIFFSDNVTRYFYEHNIVGKREVVRITI